MVRAIVLAGGGSVRMGTDKLKLRLDGESVLRRSLLAFDQCREVDEVIVAAADQAYAMSCIEGLSHPARVVPGGDTRQQSVCNALSLCEDEDIVLIHDGARPFVSKDCIRRCIASVKTCGTGVLGVPVHDTLKRVDDGMQAVATIDRRNVYAMQTPQGFLGRIIKRAHALSGDFTATDDAGLVEHMGEAVTIVMGDPSNRKLTVKEDLPPAGWRVGQGYDVHRLVEGRPLILCGVPVPHTHGLLGHSDADVAAHALMDAILGALALGDIGRHFPDTDPAYAGADSMELLSKVAWLAQDAGFAVGNCQVTILAQAPKLQPFIEEMQANLAAKLQLIKSQVGVSATTTEGLGFVGEKQGIAAQAIVMMRG